MKQNRPIATHWFTKKEEDLSAAPTQLMSEQADEEQEEDTYKHTIAAITAITEEDLEFFTPPEDSEMDDQLPRLEIPSHLGDPMYSNDQDQPRSPDSRLKRVSLTVDRQDLISLTGSFIRRGSYQAPRRLSIQPRLLRSHTLAFHSTPTGGVFGSNRENVERILKRMASAIKMDLHLQ